MTMVDVNETIAIYNGLITKPVLKDKLLQKPPFRFLHDLVTSLQKAHNFPPPACFYDGELDSANVTEKDDKIAFLDKAILATRLATGVMVDVKPSKIVSGLEFENTNLWLVSMAKAAKMVSEIDLADIARQVKAAYPPRGEAPPAAEVPVAEGQAREASSASAAETGIDVQAQRESDAAQEAARQAAEEEEQIRREVQREEQAKRDADAAKKADEERRKREQDDALAETSKKRAPSPVAETRDEREVTPEARERRKSGPSESAEPAAAPKASGAPASARRGSDGGGGGHALGGFPVTRAVIALSSDPPGEDVYDKTIRLLGAVIQKPKLVSKLLQKPPFRFIHDIVTSCIKSSGFPEGLYTPFELDSKNITETEAKHAFLKKLIDCTAVACGDPSLASTVSPKKIAAGLEPENSNMLLVALARACASGIDSAKVVEAMKKGVPAAEKEPAHAAAKPEPKKASAPAKGPAMPKLALGEVKSKEEDKSAHGATEPGRDAADSTPGKLSRPKTARRAPPKLKSNIIEGKKDGDDNSEATPAAGVILDGGHAEEDEEEEEPTEVLQGFDDPEPVDNGQHGKLVSDILKAQKKEKPKEEEKDPKFGFARLPSARKAQVSQSNAKSILELRQKIQKICQSANPLGKIIDFVYEDMETMNKELVKWRRAHQANLEKFEEEKALTLTQLEPLSTKLANVTAQVEEQRKKVVASKAAILRNETVIMGLLEQHAAPD